MVSDETPPHVGPPALFVIASTAGKRSDGLLAVTLYGTASVADFTSARPVVLFTGVLTAEVAQNLLTNLDGALMAETKPTQG
jgi:hypothetical protein